MDPRDEPDPNAEALLEHSDFLARLARGLIRDPHPSADQVQDANVAPLEHPPESRGNLSAWLSRVVRNRATNTARESRRRSNRELQAARPEASNSSSESVARIHLQRQILDELLALPEVQRTAIFLRYYEALTPTEIAERKCVPVKTVKTRLSRGLAALRLQLDKHVEGGRDTWLAALAPLALHVRPIEQLGGLATAGADVGAVSATGVLGGLIMKKAIVIGVAALAALAAWQVLWLGEVRSQPDVIAQSSVELRTPDEPEEAPVLRAPSLPVSDREAVPTSTASEPLDPGLGALELRLTWEGGLPAEGVEVFGYTTGKDSDRETDHRMISDEEGRVRLEELLPGKFHLRTVHDFIRTSPTIVAGETAELEVTLPSGITVRGSVVDEDGRPVPDASIWLRALMGTWPSATCVASTGADGRFEARRVGEEFSILGARGPGRLPSPEFWVNQMEKTPDGGREITFVVGTRAGGIRGTVIDPDGVPVPGALVNAGPFGGSPVQRRENLMATVARLVAVSTDSEGRFELPGGYEPHPAHNSVPIRAQAKGYPTWSGFVVVPESGFAECEIRLQLGAVVDGTVVDFDGQPVVGARIVCAEFDSGRQLEGALPFPSAKTDSEGAYRMELVPPGWQDFGVLAENDRLSRDYRSATCASGETTSLDFRLDPHPLVRGSVVDGEGIPLSGWRVESYPDRAPGRQTETDERGEFLLSNVGDLPLTVRVFSPGEWRRSQLTVDALPDGAPLTLVVEETKLDKGFVTGFVRNLDDSIPTDTRLGICSDSNPNVSTLIDFDDDTGAFSYGPILTGNYRLLLTRGVHRMQITDWFRVEANKTRDIGTLRPRPSGRIALQCSGVELSESLDPMLWLSRKEFPFERFDWVDGRLESQDVPEGEWTLTPHGSLYCPPPR